MSTTTTQLDDFESGIAGIYGEIPFADYLRCRRMSQSVLKCGRDSMKHLKYELDRQAADEPSDDMTLGSALHTCFLEPEQMPNRVARWDGPRRAGKEWEQFCDDNAHKAILTGGMHENLIGMVRSLRSHPEIKKWVAVIESVETSCLGEIEGIPFKGRVDALTDDPICDLKKIRSGDDRTVDRTIWDFGYHIQGYIYTRLFGRSRFCLGLIEGTEPFDVRVIELSQEWLKIGERETLALIQRVKKCIKDKNWPGRSEQLEEVVPPQWVTDQIGGTVNVTIGGQEAFAD